MKKVSIKTEVAFTIADGRLFCELKDLYEGLNLLKYDSEQPVLSHDIPVLLDKFNIQVKETMLNVLSPEGYDRLKVALEELLVEGDRQSHSKETARIAREEKFTGSLSEFPRYINIYFED